ncbi:MAG: ABC transporter permease [Eubacteriales bacterium]|nr:ABC transporter permease [Eubacteriales bacterium]
MKNRRENTKKRMISRIVILILMLLVVAFSKQLFSWGDVIDTSMANMPPGKEHIFGTDNIGRDLLCRSFIGLRLSLLIAAVMQVICLLLGVTIGTVTAYFGGIVDKLFVFLQSVILSFPGNVVTLCVMMILGNGIFSMMVALCIFGWLSYARLTRSQVMTLRSADFIRGEIAIGTSVGGIIFRHIVPSVLKTLIPMFTLMIGHSVLGIAGLSFLGFGVQPPHAEIGLLIQDGLVYIRSAPWMFIFPGLTLAAYSLMFNTVGDSMQDYFDPHDSVNAGKM